MEGCVIFVNGDAAVTLIHLIPNSFTFSFLFAVFPSHFFLPPGLSAGESWQEPTKAVPPGVQPAFGGHQEFGDFSWTSSTTLPPGQGCHGQWEGLAPGCPILTPIASFPWGLSGSAHGKDQV